MSVIPVIDARRPKFRLTAELATTLDDIRASQALRYRVFAEELGANVSGAALGIDEDQFDPYCQHLLVREGPGGRIVASTRLLLDRQAAKAGGFYSSSEFELDALLALPGNRLEIGRTCVDPTYRQGAAIAVLWAGLAEFVKNNRVDMLFGCASIPMDDGGIHTQAIMKRVRQHALTDAGCRVMPKNPVPPLSAELDDTITAPLPPLLKAYFRLGARACGEPCYDPAFNCADILVLVKVDEIDASYSRHFLDRISGG
ncbi:MAG: GNAT family N-acetyltransferase [Chromatiaceae bacterium]|nr:GNAT family N-acetyltransferase [Gammaproteobacteria bacterium]MCP5299968.1 GNAT family N-acetyltransferase [Chromatiaceae bacterium]MCP5422040.1 GNAT family N-acetyltransferase [Chromatiaceae bacterium]